MASLGLVASLLPSPKRSRCRAKAEAAAAMKASIAKRPYTSVMIIPTGTGASIGGYAGDALPVARTLASAVDCLITHPNVLNGAMLYWPIENTLYVEGYAMDQFAAGTWGLLPVHQNRVGLVLDSGIEEELRLRHLQVADAARATLGLNVLEHTSTDEPLEVTKWIDNRTGASSGTIRRPGSLLRAVEKLVKDAKVEAVAVVARFPDDGLSEVEDYRHGQGVDALAGVEAVISHMVVREFQVPCAHAPALSPLPLDPTISPRSAAEEIGYTFLPSVLAGLSRAPQYVSKNEPISLQQHCIWSESVDSVLVPVNACGGLGTLEFSKRTKRKPLIIVVEENTTVLNDTPEKMGIEAVRVANYWEAIGVVVAHKAGVNPLALRKHGTADCRSFAAVPSQPSVKCL